MKNYLLILFIASTMKLSAQSDFDFIGHDQFYIIKVASNLKSSSKINASGIKSRKVAEQQFGTNYKAQRKFGETTNEYYDEIIYDDGLKIRIPEHKEMDVYFDIMSDKYIMQLTNDQTIRVGMRSDDLKAIFPKSFSKRKIIDNIKGKIGKVGIIVYFSRTLNGKVQIEDSWTSFILNKENGILEEFYTCEPS
jgi:hypothetical protein